MADSDTTTQNDIQIDFEGIRGKMSELESHFATLADTLETINDIWNTKVNVLNEAIYGIYGEKILANWEANASTFGDFYKNFENWSALVSTIIAKNIDLEADILANYKSHGGTLDGIAEARESIKLGNTGSVSPQAQNVIDRGKQTGEGQTITYTDGSHDVVYTDANGNKITVHYDENGDIAYRKVEKVGDDGTVESTTYYDPRGKEIDKPESEDDLVPTDSDDDTTTDDTVTDDTATDEGWSSYDDVPEEYRDQVMTEEEYRQACRRDPAQAKEYGSYEDYLNKMHDELIGSSGESDGPVQAPPEMTEKSRSFNDTGGETIVYEDASGNQHRDVYDAEGNLLYSTENPVDGNTTYYDPSGNPITRNRADVLARDNAVHAYVDEDGYINASGSIRIDSTDTSPVGDVESVNDVNNWNGTTYTFTNEHGVQVSKFTNNEGEVIGYALDISNRPDLNSGTNPETYPTHYYYNADGIKCEYEDLLGIN